MSTFTSAKDAFGWKISTIEATEEVVPKATTGTESMKEMSVAEAQGATNKGLKVEKVVKEQGGLGTNVFRPQTMEEYRNFQMNDDKATKEWDAFIAARRGGGGATNGKQIGDVGSGIWFESIAVGGDDAALSLVMSVGLPMKRRREIWKRWAEGRRKVASTAALDDIEAAAGAALSTSEWKRVESKAIECCAYDVGEKGGVEPWPLKVSKATLHTIDVDLKRTMNSHPHFHVGGKGLKSLKKILVACALADENVSYLQGMNFIAAFLMLTFMNGECGGEGEGEGGASSSDSDDSIEEDVFKVTRMFTSGVLKGYYTPGLPTLLSDTNVLTQLMKKTDPKYFEHLSGMGFDLTLVCPQWFIASFVTSMRMEWTARIWDLILFANAATGGGGGVMVWLGMCIMNATRGKIMNTDSICRAITEIRRYTMSGIDSVSFDLFNKAGLSVHSFLDGRKLRAEVGRMQGGGKRARNEDRETAPPFQTPMTKRRRSALQTFASKNGITKDQVEGQFLFSPLSDIRVSSSSSSSSQRGKSSASNSSSSSSSSSNNLIDKAESFFKRAAELMTPTPRKKPRRMTGGVEKENYLGGRQLLDIEEGRGEDVPMKSLGTAAVAATPTKKAIATVPGFLSPNKRGFEMTPIRGHGSTTRKKRKSTTANKSRIGVNSAMASTPHRTTHFFKSPERTLLSPSRQRSTPTHHQGFKSPLTEMR